MADSTFFTHVESSVVWLHIQYVSVDRLVVMLLIILNFNIPIEVALEQTLLKINNPKAQSLLVRPTFEETVLFVQRASAEMLTCKVGH